MSHWDRFFFEPRSTTPAALVRILWGLLAALWGLTLLPDLDPFFTDSALRYELDQPTGSWSPLDWTGWSGAPLAVCIVLIVAGGATSVGAWTRLSSVVAALCMLSLQRVNPFIDNSGDWLLRQIGIVVALSPAGLRLSVDAWRARRRRWWPPPNRALWALRFLQLNVALGYFLSGWGKARGGTWHEGTALGIALRIEDLQRFSLPDAVFEQSVLLNLATWAVLGFELAFAFVVWNRRLRPWVLGTGIAFHLGIDLLLDVGFFSYAIFAAYLAFVPPDAADRLVAPIERRLGLLPDAADQATRGLATAAP